MNAFSTPYGEIFRNVIDHPCEQTKCQFANLLAELAEATGCERQLMATLLHNYRVNSSALLTWQANALPAPAAE